MANKKNTNNMNPVAAGLVGAAVGAAVGVAAAELSVKENRDAAGKKLGEIKEEGEKIYSNLQKKVEEVKGKAE